jgi:hypothetical protein
MTDGICFVGLETRAATRRERHPRARYYLGAVRTWHQPTSRAGPVRNKERNPAVSRSGAKAAQTAAKRANRAIRPRWRRIRGAVASSKEQPRVVRCARRLWVGMPRPGRASSRRRRNAIAPSDLVIAPDRALEGPLLGSVSQPAK